jgi:GGDEF domain-containing protein
MGLGAMVVVVCLLGAVTLRRGVNWLLAGVAGWTLFTATTLNGYFAVWFTPDAAFFNDSAKHFTGVVLGGLTLALTAASLDPRSLRRSGRILAYAVLAGCVVIGVAQAAWLPLSWRVISATVCAGATIVGSIILCVQSAIRSGRQVTLVSAGVACFTGAWALALIPRDFAPGLDLRSAFVGMLLYAGLLLIRQALIARERHGRDVLGRAAVSANRDPLTALFSYTGFELAYEEAMLRQQAGARASSMMLFLLPALERSGEEHGYEITERALVRFAAALQASLGDAWSIARLSQTRFACISTQPYDQEQVQANATQVLARCARISLPLAPLADFGLRIACLRRPLAHDGLRDLLVEMEEAAVMMEEGKRIAFV